jgi:hypothetical protein
MSIKIDIDVNGVERTLKEIERKLRRGGRKGVKDTIDQGKNRAQDVIRTHDRIFNYEVYHGFITHVHDNNDDRVRGTIGNKADHAEAVDEGATYDEEGPPIEALMPWVMRKLRGWDLDFDSESYVNYGPEDSDGE